VVKQLESELRSFKEAPGTHRSSSPPIPTRSNFVFQPLDEYPTASSAPSASPFDDPDVWRPPSRDQQGRRSGTGRIAGGVRRNSNEGAWARGGTSRTAAGGARGGKSGGTAKGASGTRSSNVGGPGGKKGKGSSSKGDSQVFSVNSSFVSFLILTR
jgi:katanin p60 ATPase-containing subunit A1